MLIFFLIHVELLPERDLPNLKHEVCLSVHIYNVQYCYILLVNNSFYLQSDVVLTSVYKKKHLF